MNVILRATVIFLALAFGAVQSLAQDAPALPAVLIADDVLLLDDNRLTARGNVEAMYQGQRLQAQSITYDRRTETLEIIGPIILHDAQNNIVTLASSGQLDRDMQNGILRGARTVMDDQLQIAANEMSRVNGRYAQLYKATVTSCRLCEEGHAPLWQIRARRVIHDQLEQQLYFDDAQFRVLDVPVFYLPRLRLPDPTLERATGFLIPSLHNSTQLGTGAKVPYFIRLGDHRDLTLTPFLSTNSRTLELRYRQAFRTGDIELNAAVSDDNFGQHKFKSYFFGVGRFDLKHDFELTFDIEAVSDDTYLLDYSYSDKDRLDSEIAVARVRRDEYIRGALTHFHTLRVGESNSTLPTIVGNAEYERRIHPRNTIGGELRFAAVAHSHFRSSDLTTDGPDFDVFADGRDVTRLTASANWHRNWTIQGGIRARVQTGLDIDGFHIRQGGGITRSSAAEVTPSGALRLRWPLQKVTPTGAAHVIEPMLQFGWVGGSTPNIPNDESTRVEFDEGNLLSMSHFTASDRRDRGATAAYGINWTRFDPDGWQSSLTLGQVIHDKHQTEPNGQPSFSNTSGLQDRKSDLLAVGQIKTTNGFALTARGIFDGALNPTKAEARASWKNKLANIGATYIWLQNDLAEDRPTTISEWAIDGSYRLSRHWTGSAQWRYDVVDDSSIRAGLGLKYTNECVDIAFSASRRFTSSTILAPSTNFSFTVGLRGFSTKTEDKSYVRTCRN